MLNTGFSGSPIATVNSLSIIGNNIFSATGTGVYLSTNNGSNWGVAGLSSHQVNSFAVLGNNIFAATKYAGVLYSNNNGNSWISIDTNINDSWVTTLAISGNNIYAGTISSGVWVHSLSGVGIEEKNEIGNINIYPNPFTSQTTVSFSEYQNNSSIKIFDLQGKVIKSMMFSGKEFELEKDAMQAGMYLMQITDDKQNFTSEKILIQ
jgi:hypothetical protein